MYASNVAEVSGGCVLQDCPYHFCVGTGDKHHATKLLSSALEPGLAQTFLSISTHLVVSLSAMVSSYSRCGPASPSLHLFVALN